VTEQVEALVAGRPADDELGAEGQRLALALAGRDSTWLYDGSLAEWSSRPDLPLVAG
jgi:hypothetical protein